MTSLHYSPSFSFSTFLVVFAAMAITLYQFGSGVPFLDEWDAEAAFLYQKYTQGTLQFSDLFYPHNEHRIFFTRFTALLLFMLNSGWDPELQMIVSGLLHALTAAFLVYASAKYLREPYNSLLVMATLVLFAVPYSWMSILVAFQTQFYYMVLFGLLALWALSKGSLLLGHLLAVFSFLAMTPGAFVWAAYAGVILVEAFQGKTISRNNLVQLIVCSLLFAIAILTRTDVPSQDTYLASSLYAFLISLAAAISWPFRVGVFAGLIVYVPFALFLLQALFVKGKSRFFLGLGFFVLLQILAMAIFRGMDGAPPGNRYWQIMLVGVWLNVACLLDLTQKSRNRPLRIFAAIWFTILAIGMLNLARLSLSEGLQSRLDESLNARALITEYLASGDSGVFAGVSGLNASYRDTERLTGLLSDPVVVSILPSTLNKGNDDRLGNVKNTLLRSGWFIGAVGLGLLLWQLLGKYASRERFNNAC